MYIIVVVAHPNHQSFNHAIANVAQTTLEEKDHEVIFHDLYAEEFNPILPTIETQLDYELASEIKPYCQEISKADGIIIVHPNWYGMPPAILVGWVDRVFCS